MLRSPLPSRAVLLAAVAALAALSASVSQSGAQAPSPPAAVQSVAGDPVSGAVAEASRRFGVPEAWIWSVMRVESAGRVRAVSHAGAMGLMQVMPQTYAELRSRHGLGPDPFNVRDNVLAGTAYLREMHDRYGVQGMLAAYNAGPRRWEAYVRAGRRLPAETIGYLARLVPEVGAVAVPMTSPAQPVSGTQAPRPTLFVQIGGASAAAPMQLAEPVGVASAAGRSATPTPTDSLFATRAAAPARTDERHLAERKPVFRRDVEPTPSTPTSSLFVPLSHTSDRP